MNFEKNGIPCPTCGKKNSWTLENTTRPFCSERCKLIDLGEWAKEKYRVSGDPVDPHELPDQEQKEEE